MADIELSTVAQETTIDPAGDKFPFIDVSATPDDTNWAAINDMVKAFFQQGSDVASAGTISLGQGTYFNITGTTTITDIDFAPDFNGRFALLKFAGILQLTNSATLINHTGANITTAAGGIALVISEGSDIVRVVYFPPSALGGGGGITNGAGNNVIPKSDGTNIVASSFSNASADIMTGSGTTSLELSSANGTRMFFDSGNYIQIGGDGLLFFSDTRRLQYRNDGAIWALYPEDHSYIDLGLTAKAFGHIHHTYYIEGAEMAAPGVAPTNGYRLFAVDNGSGKTQLKVIFQSGAAQLIATEP